MLCKVQRPNMGIKSDFYQATLFASNGYPGQKYDSSYGLYFLPRGKV